MALEFGVGLEFDVRPKVYLLKGFRFHKYYNRFKMLYKIFYFGMLRF